MRSNRTAAVVCAGLALVVGARAGLAQSVTGSGTLEARCGGSQTVGFRMNASEGASLHGDCPSPRTGGLASSNDASEEWGLFAGEASFHTRAHTDFFGTFDDAGSAFGSLNCTVQASDLTFTDVANPGREGAVEVSFNFLAGVRIDHLGVSNCNPFQPYARAYLDVHAGSCSATGARTYEPDFGELIEGIFIGGVNDGAMRSYTTPASVMSLVNGQSVFLQFFVQGNVLYCDHPPAAEGLGEASIAWRLPCGSPVFNLPPGITANCPSLGIVDNRWTGCCPADFNGDGFLDFFDYDDFVNCFETGVCPPGTTGDFNGDGFADFFDYDAFVGAFEAGC